MRLSPAEVFDALLRPDQASDRALDVVRKVRLQRTVAAGLSGAALGLCGAQMQTIFRNPLADPFVLGITGGASFGVAVVVLTAGTGASHWIGGLDVAGKVGITLAAFVGAMAVTLVALAVAHRVRGTASILVVGLMIGYLLAALVSLLVAAAEPDRLRQFVTWGFGSFRGVTNAELKVMAPVLIVGIAVSLLSTKTLNALLLGERYAESMGVAVRRDRLLILLVTSMLAGVVTAFVGPIAFVGLAAPHLARPLVATSDHRILLPAAALIGAVMTLIAEVVAQLPGQRGVLPLNAVTALLGVPVVIWVLTRRSRSEVIT
ncbi:MAG: transport system permease protein [Desertimonas sp.]|nr:transport system permease protein [Desertimonas sp.]